MKYVGVLFLVLSLSSCVAVVPFVEPDTQALANGECPSCRASLRYQQSLHQNTKVLAKQSRVEKLVKQLSAPAAVDRAHAAFWLGEMNQNAAPAVPALISSLKDPSNWVRRASTKALGKIGDSRAIEPLKALKRDKDKFVAESASSVVAQLTKSS